MSDSIEDNCYELLKNGEFAYQNKEFSKAQKILKEAANCFSEFNNLPGKAWALTNLGAALADNRQYLEAIEPLEEAISLHKITDYEEGEAMARFSLASTLFDCGQIFRSKKLFEDSEPLFSSTGNKLLAEQAKKAIQTIEEIAPKGLTDDEQNRFDSLSAQLKTATETGLVSYQNGNLSVAVRHWKLALQASQALNLDLRSAELLLNIGVALCHQGHLDDGVKYLEEVAFFAHKTGYYEAESTAFNNLGCVNSDLGNIEAAVNYLEQAIKIRISLQNPERIAESKGNLGMVFVKKGDILKALEMFSESLSLYEKSHHQSAVTFIQEKINNIRNGEKYEDYFFYVNPIKIREKYDIKSQLRIAREYEITGDYQSAVSIYTPLIDVARQVEDKGLESLLLNALGFAFRRLGHYSHALMSYQEALSAARKAADRDMEALALNNLGVLYADSDSEVARNFLKEAANLRKNLPEKHALGETYASLSSLVEKDEKKNYLKMALTLLEPDLNPKLWGIVYSDTKRLLSKNELSGFTKTYAKIARRLGVVDFKAEKNIGADEVFKLHDLVNLEDEGGIGLLVATYDKRNQTSDYERQLRGFKAESLWTMNRRDKAVQEYFAIIDEIENQRNKIFDYQRQKYFTTQWSIYDTLISYLIEENRIEEALEVVERTKSRSLLDLVGDVDYLPLTIPEELRKSYRNIRRKLRQISEEFAELQKETWREDSEALFSAKKELARLSAALEQILAAIYRYEPDFNPDLPIRVPDYEQMRGFLRSEQHAFIVYWFGEKICGAFLVSNSGLDFFHLPESICTDNTLFNEFQKTLDAMPIARTELEESLETLYQNIFKPLESYIEGKGIRELTIIPHYYAHLIPFHALGVNQNYLLNQYVIDYVPSFALYQLSFNRQKFSLQQQNILIIANPDGTLKSTEVEAEHILEISEDATVLVGDKAKLSALLENIGSYEIIHFACHAKFGLDQGQDIGLLLAPSQNHNGFLSLRQIITNVVLKIGALVILSACKTGRTEINRSDDLIGLPGGFILSGATAVIGSLWEVEDVSTSLLMHHFYAQLLSGVNVTSALQIAQSWIQKLTQHEIDKLTNSSEENTDMPNITPDSESNEIIDTPYSHPYYWAGFFAIGA